ncbi:monofunctional biosynthetic peptidoglycan transglycosylase [Robertkochia aurantiaca]|uniref:monofunctional biosynthetic peptidoglycan transglycosylase n=1 Tax=Robertkochia aurantiaca TaxID=2873700 RepID=UPI001CCADD47|nr:monofunctional biosynthetic peptidoglycan transglycosylase [Robertkochia sp. 3YJGBD-33]
MKRLLRFLAKLMAWFVLISLLLVLFYKWVPVKLTPLMVIRAVEDYRNDRPVAWEHDWETLENISDHLELAVICSEDQKFMTHNGFDLDAIEDAYRKNQKGKKIRGGSTISQQTAKNVFLWPGRSWLRKGMEAWFTVLIELMWSKEHIMEVYLNSIEMGDNIYGAEAAARHWFNKPASRLTRGQAAALASILPNPIRMKPVPETDYISRRKNWVLRQMNYFGPFQYP